MSKLKFTVSYGRTVNLGNYESARIDLSVEFWRDEVDINQAFEEVMREVHYRVADLVRARYGEKTEVET